MRTTINKLIDAANAARIAADKADKAYKEARAALQTAMIEAGINHAETAKAKASYTVSVSHGLDTKTLKKDLPELWEEYPKETRREFVTVKAI